MKKIVQLFCVAGSVFMISCGSNNSSKDELATDIQQTDFNKADSITGVNNASVNLSNQPQQTPGANSPRPTLNPPHGQPWHDCSVDEGKPLPPLSGLPDFSAGVPPVAPVNNSTVLPASTTPITNTAPQPTGQKPLLNPAHGQPWHDCAIGVGEPLSKSAATPQSQPQVFPSLPAPITKPAIQPTTANTPKPKLNPAHGQPWHRCDINPGVPLDSPVVPVGGTPTTIKPTGDTGKKN